MNVSHLANPSQVGMEKPKNILFCGHSAAHFPYYSTTIAALLKRGHAVRYLYDQGRVMDIGLGTSIENFTQAYPNFTIGTTLRRNALARYPIMWCRELGAVASYLSRPEQSPYYVRRATNYLPPGTRWLIQVPVIRRLLASRRFRQALASSERAMPANKAIMQQIASLRPHVVVCSPANMHASVEIEYLKAAKSLCIPTIVPVPSWDNLSTKGLIHVAPDLLLAWNSIQVREAIDIHGIDANRIAVTGAPFFDKWFDPHKKLSSRSEALPKFGLDPGRPYLLYLGSSGRIAQDETWVVDEILKSFATAPDSRLRDMQVLIRPHPANVEIYRTLVRRGVSVWPRQKQLPEEAASQQDFVDSIHHSVLCAGVNTSGMIDAIIHDYPVAALILDRYRSTQAQTVHFRHLRAASCLYEIEKIEELPNLVASLQTGETSEMRQLRRDFVKEFVRPHGVDKEAGELAAWCIDQLANGMSGDTIGETLVKQSATSAGAGVNEYGFRKALG